MLKVGIISANWGAKSHLPAWRLQAGVEVAGICTSRQETAEAAAIEFDIERPFWSFEEMCADPAIDIVDCGTTPLLREKMVACALAHGKHVVNQIPFTASLDVAQALVDAQRATGVQGIAAASMVGLPQVAQVKSMIGQGAIGEIMQVRCDWQMSYFIPAIAHFPYNWFANPGLGVSVTRNQGSHLLHLLRHLFGPIEAVSGRMETRLPGFAPASGDWVDNGTDDTLHAMLRMRDCSMVQLSTSWVAVDSPGFTLDIFGREGRLTLSGPRFPGARSLSLYVARPTPHMQPMGDMVPIDPHFLMIGDTLIDPDRAEDPAAGEQLPSIARLFHGLVEAIRGGEEPMACFDRALEVQKAVEALYRSNENGRWEVVE